MRLTIKELKNIVEEMEKENVEEINLDIECSDLGVDSIDFDIWKNAKFLKTILTIEGN